jgi:hypothetical protein
MSDSLHDELFCFRRHTFAIKSLSSSENVLKCYDSRGSTTSVTYFRRVRLLAISVFHVRRVPPSVSVCPRILSRHPLCEGFSWKLILFGHFIEMDYENTYFVKIGQKYQAFHMKS